MRGGGQQRGNEAGRLSQPAPQAFPPHPALIALVRLLARSAARSEPDIRLHQDQLKNARNAVPAAEVAAVPALARLLGRLAARESLAVSRDKGRPG